MIIATFEKTYVGLVLVKFIIFFTYYICSLKMCLFFFSCGVIYFISIIPVLHLRILKMPTIEYIVL